jgi:TonB family protein
MAVRKPEFMLPIELPDGLAEAILKKTKCSDAWIGVVKTSVDRTGRVQTLSLGGVGARGGCLKALEAMLRLSLAEPVTITSPLETTNLLVVKPRGRSVCFDDDPITDTVSPRYLMRVGNDVTAPKVVHREEPVFPRNARQAMKAGNVVIIAESVITKTGCVRDVYLVQQSPFADLNTAAVLALSQWKFKPGMLNGKPVDVIFHLSINFKTF